MQIELLASIGMLLLMGLVFIAAYYASRFLAQRYQGGTACLKNMKVIERMPLGRDTMLLLVQVHQRVCLLGVTGKSITLLQEFDAEGFDTQQTSELLKMPKFADVLKKFREKGSGDDA